jgi:hypothetical protein
MGRRAVSIFVWSMVGIALWHFTVLVPDKFAGGIIGAFLAAFGGGLLSGYLQPAPGIPTDNPGVSEAQWAFPGAIAGLALSYFGGARRVPTRRAAARPGSARRLCSLPGVTLRPSLHGRPHDGRRG